MQVNFPISWSQGVIQWFPTASQGEIQCREPTHSVLLDFIVCDNTRILPLWYCASNYATLFYDFPWQMITYNDKFPHNLSAAQNDNVFFHWLQFCVIEAITHLYQLITQVFSLILSNQTFQVFMSVYKQRSRTLSLLSLS